MLIGLVLAVGGLRLISLGGAWYYALAGLGMIGAGALMWRGRAWGAQLYWLVLAATVLWALSEVGFEFWSLAPRVLWPALLGLWIGAPWVTRKLDFREHVEPPTERLVRMHISTTAAAIAFMVLAVLVVRAAHGPAEHPTAAQAEAASDWPQVGHDFSGDRFALPMQINPDNVSALHVEWTYHTGWNEQSFEATPILAHGLLIFCTARDVVIGLDPETGEQRWRYDPQVDVAGHPAQVCRGIASGAADTRAPAGSACAEQIYLATIDARLVAIDAATGQPCARFGHDGVVSLMEGIGAYPKGSYYSTSPPLAADGVVIVGAGVRDDQVDAPSGVVRAFDAETGSLRWAWDLGRPDRQSAPPEGRTYTPGTPNAWAVFSADTALGLIYLPMGNPSPHFWGGKRRDSDEHYGSAIVALDIRSGAPRWSFQTTHHDLWDYDLAAQPVLVDFATAQGQRQALVQATKRGDVFVLDRGTGQPILPVEERRAPHDAAPGDHVSSTQPYSAATLAPRLLTERDMWGVSPLDQLLCRIQFRELRYDGPFTPPGVTASLRFPGSFGAIGWGGLSIDPQRGILIANTSAIPYVDQLLPRSSAPPPARQAGTRHGETWGPQEGTPYVIHTRPFLSRLQIPCTAPPWGRLSAIDLATGRLLWSHPFGTAYDSGPDFIASHLPITIGAPNMGGAITTRSGLIFIAASVDNYLRAFDTRTGEELWRGRLPAAGHATPMTFVGENGRQYVVVAAGGNASMGPKLGDALVAFSLPENLVHGAPKPN